MRLTKFPFCLGLLASLVTVVARLSALGRNRALLFSLLILHPTTGVYVDGVLRLAGLPFADSGEPIGICLAAGKGTAPNPTVWHDDLVVSPCLRPTSHTHHHDQRRRGALPVADSGKNQLN